MKTLIIVALLVALAICYTGVNPLQGTWDGMKADLSNAKSQIIDSSGVTKQ
jgi:hypothetical protein